MNRWIFKAGLVLFLLMISGLPGWAQAPGGAVKPVVTVDGRANPELVPEWILWRELFHVAVFLAEKAPDQGKDVWINRVRLSPQQMNQLIGHGVGLMQEEAQSEQEIKGLMKTSGAMKPEVLRGRLRQLQADSEKRILAYRDRLGETIGSETILKMLSFARLHIAPGVRMGGFVPADRK